MKEEINKDNIFVELAKVKGQPSPLKVDTTEADNSDDDSEGQLTVDVYQDKDDIVVQSTVAGVDPNELEINITNEAVTIKGARERTQTVDEKDYFYQECFWGTFSRSIVLPQEVDPEKSTASVTKNGVLTVRMPRLNRSRSKKLKVKAD